MITEQAVVTRRQGSQVEVRLLRESACGHCELSRGCGTGAIGRLLGNRSRPLVLESREALEPGDRLELGLSESVLVRASLVTYGLPLLGMIAAAMVAVSSGFAEPFVVLFSIAGLYAGMKAAARILRRLEGGGTTPYIVDIRVNSKTNPES